MKLQTTNTCTYVAAKNGRTVKQSHCETVALWNSLGTCKTSSIPLRCHWKPNCQRRSQLCHLWLFCWYRSFAMWICRDCKHRRGRGTAVIQRKYRSSDVDKSIAKAIIDRNAPRWFTTKLMFSQKPKLIRSVASDGLTNIYKRQVSLNISKKGANKFVRWVMVWTSSKWGKIWLSS